MAFAIQSGDFSATTTWDTGVVPTGSENAYANSFTIQVGGTVSCGRVRNDATTFLLPGMPIPVMTSNTTPSGTAFASTQAVGQEAWRAFDQNTATGWATTTGTLTGVIGYQFPTARIIKRYLWRASINAANNPRNWTFQGSNDGVNYTTLDTVTGSQIGASATYISTGLTNSNAYSFYRMNITLNNGGANTLQVAELEMTELTGTVNGGVAGGTFNLLNGSDLTVTASTGVVVGSTTPPITFALAGGNSATVNATIPTLTTTAEFRAVLLNGLGTLNFNGNISCGPTSTTNVRVIHITAAGTLNYSGVCTNGGNTTNQTNSIFSSAAANVNIITTGFAGGNVLANANASVFLNNGGTLNITSSGNIIGGNSPAVVMVGGSLSLSGSVVGSSLSPAITNSTTVTPIDVDGSVTAGNGSTAIVGLGAVTLTGPLINTNGYMAVNAPSLFITTATTYWSFTSSGGSPTILYTDAPTNTTGFPSSTDVRKDIVYGPTNTTIGTMNVPLPSDVRINVPTDDTVGTATLTAQDLFDAISGSTSGVGLRLKNVATVATVGKQIASYNI